MEKGLAFVCCCAALVGVITTAEVWATQSQVPPTRDREQEREPALIQLAILLDSSSSMSGLLNQARTQLWKIVNEFALARSHGQLVDLRVAFYEYGKNTLPAATGHLRQILPLTTDLDKVSEELAALKTSERAGADEYCGWAIRAAADSLSWSASSEDLKMIVIAGNEAFTQGPVDYREACRTAIAKGIIVNTIFCGSYADGISKGWKDGARRADGAYTSIDQNRRVTHVATPQDAEIVRLGEALNRTYVPYGRLGRTGRARQEAQDRNAEHAGEGVLTERATAKSSRFYLNPTWDLLDAVHQGRVQLEKLEKKDLPEEMRSMNVKEMKTFLEEKAKERQTIQARIQVLNEARRKNIARLAAKQPAAEKNTLDEAVIQFIREQAQKKSIEFRSAAHEGRLRKP